MTRRTVLLTWFAGLAVGAAPLGAAAQPWSLTGNAGTDPASNYLGTQDSQPLILRTGGLERLRIDVGGRLGIGTATPPSAFSLFSPTPDQAAGMVHLRVTQPFAGRFRLLTAAKRSAANDAQLDWTFELASGDTPALELFRVRRPVGGAPDFLRGALTVGWDGKVGIGTTSPREKLEVAGDVRFLCANRCVSGSGGNSVTAGVQGATIAGGGLFVLGTGFWPNSVTDNFGAVGGGSGNRAGDGAGVISDRPHATVAGGFNNHASGARSVVSGGEANRASGEAATVSGGGSNQALGAASTVSGGVSHEARGDYATIGGGAGHVVLGRLATVGGGEENQASGDHAAIAGGRENVASGAGATVGGGDRNRAAGTYATVAGGQTNVANEEAATVGGGWDNQALGKWATVAGGGNNSAVGFHSTVPGGQNNSARGSNSLAAGSDAKAEHLGAFVWADARGYDFASTANNQFSVRAGGGVRLIVGVDAVGNPTNTCTLDAASTSWSCTSDGALKELQRPANGREVLEKLRTLPVHVWRLKGDPTAPAHLGPTAQDFRAAFALGDDDRRIASGDLDGVALAAIQGLAQLVEGQEREAAAQRERIRALEQRLSILERLLEAARRADATAEIGR